MGDNLNITYYFGQIRAGFRGDLALFMGFETPESQDLIFNEVKLDSPELFVVTSKNHNPIRSYIGVNKSAKTVLERIYRENRGNLRSAFDLDAAIATPEAVHNYFSQLQELGTEFARGIINSP